MTNVTIYDVGYDMFELRNVQLRPVRYEMFKLRHRWHPAVVPYWSVYVLSYSVSFLVTVHWYTVPALYCYILSQSFAW